MFKWFRASTLDPLTVSMAGIKLADRLLIVGCTDPRLIAALARKSGLTGRTCAVDPSADRVREAERVALAQGALIEAASAPLSALPYDPDAFDIVLLRNIVGEQEVSAAIGEAYRVMRPGGRCMIINTARRAFAGIFQRSAPESGGARAIAAALASQEFVAVRTLAEREGTVFVEAIKRNVDA
jgi:ubiquinone/menaquinone biosynthesis C-methylase UbiE